MEVEIYKKKYKNGADVFHFKVDGVIHTDCLVMKPAGFTTDEDAISKFTEHLKNNKDEQGVK